MIGSLESSVRTTFYSSDYTLDETLNNAQSQVLTLTMKNAKREFFCKTKTLVTRTYLNSSSAPVNEKDVPMSNRFTRRIWLFL